MANFVLYLIFGAFFGAFLNILYFKVSQKDPILLKKITCNSCGIIIDGHDMVPIISYILLRGKCRNCKAKVSKQHLYIEILFSIIFGTISIFV